MRLFAAIAAICLLAACASAPPAFSPSPPRSAWIVATDGRPIGQAAFTQAPLGVLIRLEFNERALPPGWHGLHLHTRGDCSDFAAGFQASGGHLGAAQRILHGLVNANGPEAGDLPNLYAAQAGPFGAEVYTTHVTLLPGGRNETRPVLLDGDGSALVIHAGADDHFAQPIGGAGARLACAALTNLP